MRSLTLNDLAHKLGIRVHCNKCKSTFDPRDPRENNYLGCTHPTDKQCYKSVINLPRMDGMRQRKTFSFQTRNLSEVIEQGYEFKKHCKSIVVEPKQIKNVKPILLGDCFLMYLDFKNNVGVKPQFVKNLSRVC
jgi:hypothetical protein